MFSYKMQNILHVCLFVCLADKFMTTKILTDFYNKKTKNKKQLWTNRKFTSILLWQLVSQFMSEIACLILKQINDINFLLAHILQTNLHQLCIKMVMIISRRRSNEKVSIHYFILIYRNKNLNKGLMNIFPELK